jgi:hypothetical protein
LDVKVLLEVAKGFAMSEPSKVPVKIAKVSTSGRKPAYPTEGFDRYGMRGALYAPPEPSLPYVAVLLNAEDEVLSAKSVPTAEAGEDLVARTVGEFTNARPSGKMRDKKK